MQPLPFKNSWNDGIHIHRIDPGETPLTFVSLGVYLAQSVRRYRTYRRWLANATGDRDDQRLAWLRNFIALFTLTVAVNIAFEAFSAFVHRLSSVDFFGLYVWYAVLVYDLGMEGWRNASASYPQRARAGDRAAAGTGGRHRRAAP